MMNNQYNTANITTQHGIQMAQHVTTSPPQAAVLNTFLNAQQQQQQQQQQQLAAAVAAGAIYGDPRQLQINSNTLDKNFYTTAAATATLGALGTPQRFYTTTGATTATAGATNPTVAAAATHHPNTILITNNFAHQQAGAATTLSPEHQRNIRIVTSTSNPLNAANSGNMATTASGFQHAQHVFSLNNNKQLQHLFPQHLLHQSNFQPATTELLQQHFASQHFPASPAQQQQQNQHTAASAIQMSQFYVSPENSITGPLNTNPKIITNIPSNSANAGVSNTPSAPLVGGNGNNPNTTSTVVLDRINICINNLYTDTSSSSSASNSLASTPAQQPSPIIPAIQHKPIIENGPALPMADIYESNVLVIDEPDSTTTATTPHTPPTTPENTPPSMPNTGNNNNNNNNIISTTSSINSPSTSCNYQKLDKSNAIITTTKQSFASAAQNIEKAAQDLSTTTITDTSKISQSNNLVQQQPQTATTTSNTPLTPPTPPSPEMSNQNKDYLNETKQSPTAAVVTAPPPKPLFANGEDVFIKRHDDRFYLGTVIDTARNQFLVRFDDKTEVWCEAEEMRKLGGSTNNNSTSSEEKSVDQPMCVACKRSRLDSQVEICERCGRGYHRKCTSETAPGSEIWLCKRCAKPMKLEDSSKFSSTEEETEVETCLQLHYNVESLTWDVKHRSNEEQIYCYCGKSGKFDNNMLQCWRCLNWYHNHCTQKFKKQLLRGDCFFVFCCSVCNEGDEYLRRLQATWVDLVHLILYNLSILKKHHKTHHLLKDINPYVLEKRKLLPIPKEWISMPDKEFLDKIKCTLNENTHIFLSGKEIKRDINSFALRVLEPPEIKKIPIKPHDIFNDEFVFNHLKLKLLSGAPENISFKFLNTNSRQIENTPTSKRKLNEDSSSHDVYEFDDTSDDEIPIKRILDKVKRTKLSSPPAESASAVRDIEPKTPSTIKKVSSLEKMDVEDDNANDAVPESEAYTLTTPTTNKELTPKKETKNIISPHKSPAKSKEPTTTLTVEEKVKSEKSSRKRKAFTLSKSYTAPRLIDSSSDENSSSSSRGTSLDLIIPPPKNFLGQNNPFRIISPKKCDASTSSSSGKKSVSFGIFNTTALNFSSKLAALKSAGLFPKLSTSNLAKAAGQPRTVRTIKRRLSAKDITIGPNKEVRRRRTRRLSSNIEVISTTTINPIPTNFFPIQAKDLLAAAAASTTTAASLFTNTQTKTSPTTSSLNNNNNNNNSISTPLNTSPNIDANNVENAAAPLPSHGRRLRQRPQKNSPNASRRSSVSSNQSSTSSASAAAAAAAAAINNQTSHPPPQTSHEDLKQTVNKYFGIVNRIESGEQFSIRAKRQLANGQMQYLIEWGEAPIVTTTTTVAAALPTVTNDNETKPEIQLNSTTNEETTTNSQLMEVTTTTT